MSETINWDEVDEQYHSNFKEYANNGIHKVKLAEVKIHEVGNNGAIAQDFIFEETEVKYPKVTHWITFKDGKKNWRCYHNKALMMLLGASEEGAKKNIEACEAKGDKASIVKAYQDAYKRLAGRAPELEIEVWDDGKYSVGEFTDNSVRMSRPDDTKTTPVADDSIDLSMTESLDSNEDIPF